MMEIVVFTLNGIVIYFVSDWLVRLIETKRGAVLKQRQIVFFVIFLGLALLSFQVLQAMLTAS